MKARPALQRQILTYHDEHPCPYFEEGRICTIEYLIPDEKQFQDFHKYLAKGYRRTGRILYHNICKNCSDCKPVRIITDTFQPSRSQKRTLKDNADIRVEILPHSFITPEKILLYSKYVKSKHPENENDEVDNPAVNVLLSMHYGYRDIIEMNYYLEDTLIGVGIVDEGRNALSSHYFYYNTHYPERRLGVFSILQELALARSLGKKYYYLGFYIEENQKMSYKKYIRPNQMYENGKWRAFMKD